MKKIIIIMLIVAVSTVFAAKQPLVFAPGFEGFLGNYTQAQIDSMVTTYKTNYPDFPIEVAVVVIDGTTAEDTLKITRLDMAFGLILKKPIKAIRSKKLPGMIPCLCQVELPGGDKTQIKLPKFYVYEVIADDLKVLQCMGLRSSVTIKNSINGVTAKFNTVADCGDVVFKGRFKSISAEEFSGDINAGYMYAPAGKLIKLKSKKAMPLGVYFYVCPNQVKLFKKTDKNGYWVKNINISFFP